MTFEGFDFCRIIGYVNGYGFLPKLLWRGNLVYTGEFHHCQVDAESALDHQVYLRSH